MKTISRAGVAVGSGWQSYVAYINLGCYYLIGVPLGFIMCWVFHQDVMVRTLFSFFFSLEIFWISRDFVILSSKNVAFLLSISSAWSRIWNFSRSFLGSNVLLFFLVEVVCVWSQWMISFFKNWVILANYLT